MAYAKYIEFRQELYDQFEIENVSEEIWDCYDDMDELIGELLEHFDENRQAPQYTNQILLVQFFTLLLTNFIYIHTRFMNLNISENANALINQFKPAFNSAINVEIYGPGVNIAVGV
jgi:hypothetical protein